MNFSRLFQQLTLAILILLGPPGSPGQAQSTEPREWTSTVGTKMTAVANSVRSGQVQFTTKDGKALQVPLEKLVEADRAFLMEFFKIEPPKPGEGVDSGTPAAEGLPHPSGEMVGPITASEGASYLLYLPKSLKKDRKAPLIFLTSPAGGSQRVLGPYIEGAELAGGIAAVSMESSNGSSFDANNKTSMASLAHLSSTLPVDPERIYFTGTSGGAATAFTNAFRHKHAGVISAVGYIPNAPDDTPKGGDYVLYNGATDYNRYISAYAAELLGKKNSLLVYSPGSHSAAPAPILTDAMIWLNIRYLSGKGRGLTDERLDFEARLLRWIQENKTQNAHRAYRAAALMQESFKVSTSNALAFQSVLKELGTEANRQYADGIVEMDKWARANYANVGGGSEKNHTTPEVQSAAQNLAKKLAGVPELEQIALKLGEVTGK